MAGPVWPKQLEQELPTVALGKVELTPRTKVATLLAKQVASKAAFPKPASQGRRGAAHGSHKKSSATRSKDQMDDPTGADDQQTGATAATSTQGQVGGGQTA